MRSTARLPHLARYGLLVFIGVLAGCEAPGGPGDAGADDALDAGPDHALDAGVDDAPDAVRDGAADACRDGAVHCALGGRAYCIPVSRSNCGACGRRCEGATPECIDGRCAPCPSPRVWCAASTSCVDLRDDARHCGACGQACDDGAPCVDGRCVPCPVGAGRCGRAACESLAADNQNCGACGRRCPAVDRRAASAVCADGRCRVTCIAGTAECDGDERTICETTTLADDAHCGACGRACGSGSLCVSGRCVAYGVRPRAPVSVEALRTTQPTLHWVLGPGATGARIELCATRSCAVIERTWDVTGERFRVPEALSPGFHAWRLHARRGDAVDPTPGPTWTFSVPPHPTGWYPDAIDLNGDGFPDRVHAAYLGTDRELGQPNPAVGVEYGTATGSIPSNGVVDERLRVHSIGPLNGDFDCDGYGDFLHYTAASLGIAGPAGYLSGRTLRASLPFEWNAYSRGSDADYNGDGCIDRLIPPIGGSFWSFQVLSIARIDPGTTGMWSHANVPVARFPLMVDDDGYDDVREGGPVVPGMPEVLSYAIDMRGGPDGLRDALAP
jgi:hypothetical protein